MKKFFLAFEDVYNKVLQGFLIRFFVSLKKISKIMYQNCYVTCSGVNETTLISLISALMPLDTKLVASRSQDRARVLSSPFVPKIEDYRSRVIATENI